jgi:predicted nucleotidyltransferase/DNA-binding HxlR family transcriptional regulator
MKKNKSQRRKENRLSGLITSRTKVDILNLLFSNPGKEFYYREIIDGIGTVQRGAIARELGKLEIAGYVRRRASGNRKYYSINTDNPIYPELKSIWMKTVGIYGKLREGLEPLAGSIEFAFVYGSFASGTEGAESDIDLMIIGKVKSRDVSKQISGLSIDLGREINYSVFPVREVIERLKKGDHFWSRLYVEDTAFLMGDPKEFARLGE